jgi:hypothetical protein
MTNTDNEAAIAALQAQRQTLWSTRFNVDAPPIQVVNDAITEIDRQIIALTSSQE